MVDWVHAALKSVEKVKMGQCYTTFQLRGCWNDMWTYQKIYKPESYKFIMLHKYVRKILPIFFLLNAINLQEVKLLL